MEERLHKILAHAGYGSRRACETLIAEGRVTVNGRIVKVGDKATLGVDDIRVENRRVKAERKVYYLLNKPVGYISTSADPEERRKVTDLLPDVRERVYAVGRLDADSQGLLILTNDGDLTARLTHPRYGVPKTYEAEVTRRIAPEHLQKLMQGVRLSEGRTESCRVRVLRRGANNTILEITLHEGMNRQIRRMLAKLGYNVRRLTRTRLGPLRLYGLGVGKYRELTADEVRSLFKAAEPRAWRQGPRERPKHIKAREQGGAEAPAKVAAEPEPSEREVEPQPDFEVARRRKVYDFTKRGR